MRVDCATVSRRSSGLSTDSEGQDRLALRDLKVWAAYVGLSVALALSGCARAPQNQPPAVPKHLLFVTIDTLRADRLGCYGYRDIKTPNIDRLGQEGTLVVEADAHVPQTRPSHISIFTGRYPYEHGIRDNVSPSFVSESIPTLAEVLQKSGFRTAAFVSAIVIAKQSGLNRGFETYDDNIGKSSPDDLFLNTLQRRGDRTLDAFGVWLKSKPAQPSERLAMWLHLYDPHDPYEPPEPYASTYAGREYDGEVAWTDELIGRLLRTVGDAGILNDTLIVLTSDHGEGLGEHAEPAHGFFIYQTTMHVPLIFRGPGIPSGSKVSGVARLVDLFPTVIDLMHVPKPANITLSGQSIASAVTRRTPIADAPSFAETLVPLLHYGWSDLRSIRDARWKYILAPRPELYDLERDPSERSNLVTSQPSRAQALRGALEARLRLEQQIERLAPAEASVPPELLEKLGALGYVSPGAPAPGSASAGADPKDKVEDFKLFSRLMREALMKLEEKDYAGSASRLQDLRARGMDSFEVNFYLGRATVGRGKLREALPYFEKAVARSPAYGPAYIQIADIKAALGDFRGAIEILRKGHQATPRDASLYEREGELYREMKRPQDAIAAYKAMLPLAPKNALARIRLGEFYRDTGDPVRALQYLQEGVQLDPAVASYWNSLGMVLGGNGQLPEAETAFRRAIKIDGQNAQYIYNLGLALQRQGKTLEAAEYYRRTIEISPGFGAARQRLNEIGN
jgi:choline-sulfatase